MVAPYTVIPGTVGRSIFYSAAVVPRTVRPYRVGAKGWRETTLYPRPSVAADVSPAFHADWTHTANAARIAMLPQVSQSSSFTSNGGSFTSGQVSLIYQMVGPIMRAGVVFDGATVSAIMRARELDATDNVVSQWGLRVFSQDGSTERAVLLAVGQHGTAGEWSDAANYVPKIFANGVALASYTTVHGDRLVAEFGCTDSSGTTPNARLGNDNDQPSDYVFEDEGLVGAKNTWIRLEP